MNKSNNIQKNKLSWEVHFKVGGSLDYKAIFDNDNSKYKLGADFRAEDLLGQIWAACDSFLDIYNPYEIGHDELVDYIYEYMNIIYSYDKIDKTINLVECYNDYYQYGMVKYERVGGNY